MRLIIAGSRNFTDYDGLLATYVEKVIPHYEITQIVSGTCRGADLLGERLAHGFGIPIKRYPAQWDRYGKSAGFKRNAVMADNADALLACWNGYSKGTRHMINLARAAHLIVILHRYESTDTG